jgi:DNA-binding response OmpR family regulator
MRLLIVEDDAALGQGLRSHLASQGYAVDLATNGIDGAHLGATEPYDAVILDLGLPGKPGLAVLRDWRAAGNRVPVLVLTARDGWAERVEGLQAGADDYLGKPFHMEELVARIQALCAAPRRPRRPSCRSASGASTKAASAWWTPTAASRRSPPPSSACCATSCATPTWCTPRATWPSMFTTSTPSATAT